MCCLFVFNNPALLKDLDDSQFSGGEVFEPIDGVFDFKVLKLNCSGAKNFTARIISSGHTQFYDDTGDRTINIIEWDKMSTYHKNARKSFLADELKKTSWTVNGVDDYEIEFLLAGDLYSACMKDTSANTFVYLSTPNDTETASMINSLRFENK